MKQSTRDREDVIKNIQLHPELHAHTYQDLIACCTIDDVIDLHILDMHAACLRLTRSSISNNCDVTQGPCACGATH